MALAFLFTQYVSAVEPQTAAAAAPAVAPSLFGEVEASEGPAPASTIVALNKPINGEVATMAAPGGGKRSGDASNTTACACDGGLPEFKTEAARLNTLASSPKAAH
jgi:hypothetical protein